MSYGDDANGHLDAPAASAVDNLGSCGGRFDLLQDVFVLADFLGFEDDAGAEDDAFLFLVGHGCGMEVFCVE